MNTRKRTRRPRNQKRKKDPQTDASLQFARRIAGQPQSSLGEVLRQAAQMKSAGSEVIDLALGTPDYSEPAFLRQAAAYAVLGGKNGYGDSRGVKELRVLTSQRFAADHQISYDPDTEVTIAAGASAALNAVLLALINPGDKVLVFEPYFESFSGQIGLAGASPRFVRLTAPDFSWSDKQLERAFTARTRAVLLNSPNNPSGRVATAEELERLAWFCRKHDVFVISDEAYAPFVYDGRHISIASLPGMRQRTVVLESISKVFNVSGWRIGNILAPRPITEAIRKVSDLTLGAAVPLQVACIEALERYEPFVKTLVAEHRALRDQLHAALLAAGVQPYPAQGTFSIFADCSALGTTGVEACRFLLEKTGILAVPGNGFYRPGASCAEVRFCFARKKQTIEKAAKVLSNLGYGEKSA